MRLPLEAADRECLKLIYSDKLSCEEGTELVIPDTCPDVGRILDVRGQVLLTSKRAVSEGVAVSASLEADVIFVTEEDETPRTVSSKLSFEFSAIAKGADEDSFVSAILELCKLEARMLNPRKLLIRAEVSADVKCYKKDFFHIWNSLPEEDDGNVHLLKKDISHSLVTGISEKSFTVSDEYDMPEDRRDCEMISCVTSLTMDDVKAVGTKLVFKASTETNIVFKDPEGELFTSSFETQFSQILETEDAANEPEVDIILHLTDADFVMLPDRDSGVIAANFKIGVQAVCVLHMYSNYVADAYSNKFPLITEYATTPVLVSEAPRRQKLRLSGKLSEENCEVIYLYCSGVSADIEGEKVSFKARICGVGKTESGTLVSLNAQLRGNEDFTIEENQFLSVSGISLGNVSASHGGDSGADLFYTLNLASRHELEAICALELDTENPLDTDKLPSIVVLCADKGLSLWDIAKKYSSTMELIEEANSLTGEFSDSQHPLIIPKA